MERHTDRINNEGGSLEDIIVYGKREEMTKIRFLPRRIIGASKTSGLEG